MPHFNVHLDSLQNPIAFRLIYKTKKLGHETTLAPYTYAYHAWGILLHTLHIIPRVSGENEKPEGAHESRMPLELLDATVRITEDGANNGDVESLVQRALETPGEAVTKQGSNKVLVRAFGKGTEEIIDRDRKFAVHCQLNLLGLAPRLYAKFKNGLVYEYAPGRPTKPEELSHPAVATAVAQKLAQWHAQLRLPDVLRFMPSTEHIDDIYTVLDHWINLAPGGVLEIEGGLAGELAWLRKTIATKGGPTVMGHCDLLSGNVLIEDPVKSATFIDYEYAIPVPRAYDIANHFWEWQGFDCVRERVLKPQQNNSELRRWLQSYLGSEDDSKSAVDMMITELRWWWGMPGFYWGIWAAFQSTKSEIDFDYASYAKLRFDEYLTWKRDIYPTL